MADLSGLVLTVLDLSFNVAKTLYSYAQDVKSAPHDIQSLSTELFALIGVMERMKMHQEQSSRLIVGQMKGLTQPSDQSTLRAVLQETLQFLEELNRSLIKPPSRFQATVQKMKWPLKADETKRHLQRLERVKTYFILSLVTDDIDRTRDVASQISSLRSFLMENSQDQQLEQSREKYRKIIKWLSPVEPEKVREKVARVRTPGSGKWFIDNKAFQIWRDSDRSSCLWLNGITGAGKTTLMTTAVEEMLSHSLSSVAFYYCSFTDEASLDITNILGCILGQLCDPQSPIYEKVEAIYEEHCAKGVFTPRRPSTETLVELLLERAFDQKIVILVDAINEAEPIDLLNSLKKLTTSSERSNVLLFISSIDEKEIEASIQQMPSLNIMNLNHEDILDDVGLLIRESLEAQPRLRQHTAELKAEIAQNLTGEAQGMFRWVQCQLDALEKLRTPGAVRNALRTLPPTLDKTYEQLLCRIDGDEDRTLAREILEVLSFSLLSLSLNQVCEALQITPGLCRLDESKRLANPKDVLSICGSLLSYDRETDLLALAHQSVKTYLTSDLPGRVKFFQLSETRAHRSLAMKSLTYLGFDAFASGPCQDPKMIKERFRTFPLLGYAAHKWAEHTQRLEVSCQGAGLGDELWKTVKSFLFSEDSGRGNFRAWIQILIPRSKHINRTAPLYYAASFGLSTVVQYLLDAGAATEVQGGRCGATPLNIASYRNHVEVVRILLKHGACPQATDDGAMSAVDWARALGHREVSKLLASSIGQSSVSSMEDEHRGRQPAVFPHKCPVCNIRFSEASHLSSHARTHSNQLPFFCNVCVRRFTRLHDFKRHSCVEGSNQGDAQNKSLSTMETD